MATPKKESKGKPVKRKSLEQRECELQFATRDLASAHGAAASVSCSTGWKSHEAKQAALKEAKDKVEALERIVLDKALRMFASYMFDS